MRNAPTSKKRNYKVVYTIVERRRDGRKFWLRIGAAFENYDGSLNVRLDALPANGQLQIRELNASDGPGHVAPVDGGEHASTDAPEELAS